jgi:F0F1-type ATP synthase assembly protein I
MAEEDRGFVRTFTLNSLGVAEALYSGLSESQRALTAELLAVERPVVVQNPSRPLQPVSPRKALNVTLALILGLMLGVMLAFVRDAFVGQQAVNAAVGKASGMIGPSRRPEL